MNLSPEIFTNVINQYFSEPYASLLNGIIFGIPLRADKTFYREIQAVGLLHIVVLSGTNISILAALLAKVTSGFSKSFSLLITILFVTIFISFVRPQAPIVRAGFMSILTFVSILTGRKIIALYILFGSALFTALFWPQWIGGISFQLSYGATLGLILFSGTSKKKVESKSKYALFKNYCVEDFKTSLAAQVFTVPIIFIYFRQVSFIAPFANVAISWTIAPIMMFGFLTALLGAVNFTAGTMFAYMCYGLLIFVVFVIKTLAKIPYIFIQF